jgi:hypothetical protein
MEWLPEWLPNGSHESHTRLSSRTRAVERLPAQLMSNAYFPALWLAMERMVL